jgi:CheY-like chemotaxis protein
MASIVVIDDDDDAREAITAVLERAGFEVFAEDSGESGLARCREADPQVVISDIIMPGTHGVDVIRSVKEEFPDVGILAISGGGNVAMAGFQPDSIKTAAYIAAAELAGADRCLTKPISRGELLEAVNELLA